MKTKKILVVGSGPSAFGFINGIVSLENLDITVIDNAKPASPKNNHCKFKNVFKYGNRKTTPEENLISKDFGGFSNFWGGTYDNPSEKIVKLFDLQGVDIEPFLAQIDKIIPRILISNNLDIEKNTFRINSIISKKTFKKFSKNNIEIKESQIATSLNIEKNLDMDEICNFCNGSKLFCNETSIWKSKYFFSKLIEENKIKYSKNTKLIRFEEVDGKVSCLVATNDIEKREVYDKLIIAAGPIGTSEIFLNSNIVSKVEIKTTDLYQVPFIKFFRTRKKLHSFSDGFAKTEILKQETYQQFYFYTKSIFLLSKNSFKLLNFINLLPSFLLSCIGGLFVIFNSDISSKIVLTVNNNSIETSYIKNNSTSQKKVLRKLFFAFAKCKLFLIIFFRNEYLYGTSYHNGAQFPISKAPFKNQSDKLGRLNNLKNVHIVDASVLPDINTGPGVKLIMANSFRIGRSISFE
jgi:hypothetical protein